MATNLRIDWGTPVVMLFYPTIRIIIHVTIALCCVNSIYALCLFFAAVQTKGTIGDFLNMVTDGDGTMLPMILGFSGLACLPLDIWTALLLWRTKRRSRNHWLNTLLFIAVLAHVCVIILLFILGIVALAHSYNLHDRLHDGIVDAMKSYGNNTSLKIRVDILQITFQCCGSKTYKEWFDVPWFDVSLAGDIEGGATRDDTPFSCCAMASPFPCIHHDVQAIGGGYLYAPEMNLSVSERGCHPALTRHTRVVAWKTAVALLGVALLHCGASAGARLVQTAHCPRFRFERSHHLHTAWLFGCYRGQRPRQPPTPPPLPDDLMD